MCLHEVLFRTGGNLTETFQMLEQAHESKCLSRLTRHKWHQYLKSRRTFTEEKPKFWPPSTSMGVDHIEKMISVIRENRCLTVWEVSDEVHICKSLCYVILKEKLNLHCVVTQFVLSGDKRAKEELSCDQSRASNCEENFLKIVTDDEMLFYGYNVKTKKTIITVSWDNITSTKKAHQNCWNVKALLIFFDRKGTIHHEFVPHSQATNKEFYLDTIRCLI